MNAWIFDVDGVVTNPQEKRITLPILITYWIQLLQEGHVLALNTGRSLAWLREKVFTPLTNSLEENHLPTALLDQFFMVGEKGAVWVAQEEDNQDMSIAISQELKKAVKNYITKDFSDVMFFDDSKQTMISIEMINGKDLTDFHEKQKKLVKILEKLIGDSKTIKIDPTTIATDIENKYVGKAFGMQRILSLFAKQHLNPKYFYIFGDSLSDLDMGKELQKQNKPFSFIFVGTKNSLPKNLDFPIKTTNALYDNGTVEYLGHVLS